MYYMDFILNYPNRCIIGVKNLMTIVWKIRIYYYLRCNISMLRLICDHWFLMLDKCGVYVRVSREVSITAGITFVNDNDRACALSFFLAYGVGLYHPAGSIVKGCERRLSALAHGNYNLLIGHR